MDLMKLIMNNLHVLIIIAAVLGSIVMRLRAATRQGQASPMPPFGGGRQAAPARPAAKNPPMSIGRKEEPQARVFEEQPVRSPTVVSSFEAPSVRKTEPTRLEENVDNDIVRGIIWAELLGPPRAKRPYGRR